MTYENEYCRLMMKKKSEKFWRDMGQSSMDLEVYALKRWGTTFNGLGGWRRITHFS